MDIANSDFEASVRRGKVHSDRPYLERFRVMVAELEAREDVAVEIFEASSPATIDQIAEAAKVQPIPESMSRFYLECNGLKLRWTTKSGGYQAGSIKLLPINDVFRSWQNSIWFDEEWDSGRFRPLHPFDFFVEEACAAVFVDGSDDPPIYFHYCGEKADPLLVNFAQYLELLLQSRGFMYWQTAIASDLTGSDHVSARNCRLGMRGLFGDYDESFFFRKSYVSNDDAWYAARQTRSHEIRSKLESHHVDFRLKDDGGLFTIEVAEDAENQVRAAAALAAIGLYFRWNDDWAASISSDVMVDRRPGF